jgi:hypothetical protein
MPLATKKIVIPPAPKKIILPPIPKIIVIPPTTEENDIPPVDRLSSNGGSKQTIKRLSPVIDLENIYSRPLMLRCWHPDLAS